MNSKKYTRKNKNNRKNKSNKPQYVRNNKNRKNRKSKKYNIKGSGYYEIPHELHEPPKLPERTYLKHSVLEDPSQVNHDINPKIYRILAGIENKRNNSLNHNFEAKQGYVNNPLYTPSNKLSYHYNHNNTSNYQYI